MTRLSLFAIEYSGFIENDYEVITIAAESLERAVEKARTHYGCKVIRNVRAENQEVWV